VKWHKTGIIGAICYQNATKTKWVQGAEPWRAQPAFRKRVMRAARPRVPPDKHAASPPMTGSGFGRRGLKLPTDCQLFHFS
jgi:hypothetical protein